MTLDQCNVLEVIAGRPVVLGCSGGKDSGAAALYLKEMGLEFTRVAVDTGWEADGWADYIHGELSRVIGPVTIIRADIPISDEFMAKVVASAHDCPMVMEMIDSPMVRLVLTKMQFPSRVSQFCTENLKTNPIADYLATFEGEPVSATGIRADESERRSRYLEWEFSKRLDCWTWRPILRWSLDDVVAIHKRHGLQPNHLYFKDDTRVGCYFCVLSSKSAIRRIADRAPDRVALVRQLELVVNRLAEQEMTVRGETLAIPRTFFGSLGKYDPNEHPMIDRVVAWSRTRHGGKDEELQESLFAGNGECARWGFCDREPAKPRPRSLPILT